MTAPRFYTWRKLESGWWEVCRQRRRRGRWSAQRIGITFTAPFALRVVLRDGEPRA